MPPHPLFTPLLSRCTRLPLYKSTGIRPQATVTMQQVERLQRGLNFDVPAAAGNPAFHTNKGLGRVGLAGFVLGGLWGVHLTVFCVALFFASSNMLWLLRWSAYVVSLCLFHFMEFLSTALYKPETVTYDCEW